MGFEIEVDLPVTDAAGNAFGGDTGLATGSGFKVVTDHRTLNSGTGYSNIEFVSDPIPVVGPAHSQAENDLGDLLDRIEGARDSCYAVCDVGEQASHAFKDFAAGLTLTGEGEAATLVPGLDGYEPSEDLFVQYSVGVPLAGMPGFFDELRAADHAGRAPEAYFRLDQAVEFSNEIVDRFERERGRDRGVRRADTEALRGYAQLLYTQVAAVADYLDTFLNHPERAGLIKNRAIVLSRSRLGQAREHLTPEIRAFLKDRAGGLVNLLIDTQDAHYSDRGRHRGFPGQNTRDVPGMASITLDNYARAAFTGEKTGEEYVGQQQVFGGMHEVAPHHEEGAVMVPVEIRTFGEHYKTFVKVREDLHTLADWAQDAYAADRGLRASRRRRVAEPSEGLPEPDLPGAPPAKMPRVPPAVE